MTGNGHGGVRPGAGRPPKAEEDKLIKLLAPYEDAVIKKLIEGAQKGDKDFIKMYMEYRFGKPKQTIDANLTGELLVNWIENKQYKDTEQTKSEGSD